MGLEPVRHALGSVRGTTWGGAPAYAGEALGKTDVAVFGAGPVGTHLALALDRAGVASTLVDSRAEHADRFTQLNLAPCTIDQLSAKQSRRALESLDPIVGFDERDAVTGAVKRTAYSGSFDVRPLSVPNGAQSIVDAVQGADPRTWGRVPIGVLQNGMRADLRESGGAQALFGVKLIGVLENRPGAVRYIVEDADGNRQALTAKMLINATGSRPVDGLAHDWEMSKYHVNFVGGKYDAAAKDGAESTTYRTSPEGIEVALQGDEHTIVWRAVPDIGPDMDRTAAADQLNETAARLGVTGRIKPDDLFPVRTSAGHNRTPVDGGVVNIGDSSLMPNWRTSSGANTGLTAHVPATSTAIQEVVRGGGDPATVLARLNRDLRGINETMFHVNERQLIADQRF